MRLIDVKTQKLKTLKLEDFTSGKYTYAILSHTWGPEEITFNEMETKPDEHKAGWRKLDLSCKQAKEDGYDYVWCDTCCIDKSSSAELSESINSMFRWYQEADICYAFLEDIQDVDEIAKAKWFTRGWTLQELIAPKSLVFYVEDDNAAWREIGTRENLAKEISKITKIDKSLLRGASSIRDIHGASFAKRVSWAAKRTTTVDEDIAYCLMGLLDVNMPLLYGEGDVKAFRRLQEEYLKIHPDQSFLAWLLPPGDGGPRASDGDLLASLPKDFGRCNGISLASDDATPFTLNNKGLQIRLPLFQNKIVDVRRSPKYFAILACHSDAQPEYRVRIPLHAVERSAKTFAFLPGHEHHPVSADEFEDARLTECFILRTPPPLTPRLLSVNDLPKLISWKPKIVYLNPSTWTWDCLSKPGDLDPSILRPELSSRFPPIRVPGQRETASYGVLLHPPSLYTDTTSSGWEDKPRLKVLVRVDVGFKRRYEVNVRIQLFHIARKEISTKWENFPSASSKEIPSNSRSRIVPIPTQTSETIHASASWKRSSNQDELSLKIDIAAVDRHRADGLDALSTAAFKSFLSEDPLVHTLYGAIALLAFLMLGPSYIDPYAPIGLSISIVIIYGIRWKKKLLRRKDREVYTLPLVIPGVLLLGHSRFLEDKDGPSSRSMPTLEWLAASLCTLIVLLALTERTGYESTNNEKLSAQELDPSTGLESLLLDDTI